MTCVFYETVVDCVDPRGVAAFWGAAFRWEAKQQGAFWWMSETGNPTDSPVFVFQSVPDGQAPEGRVAPDRGGARSKKNGVHFDVVTKGCDQAEEVERLEGLGATRVDIGQGNVPWVVMADPEGNEFCVLDHRVD